MENNSQDHRDLITGQATERYTSMSENLRGDDYLRFSYNLPASLMMTFLNQMVFQKPGETEAELIQRVKKADFDLFNPYALIGDATGQPIGWISFGHEYNQTLTKIRTFNPDARVKETAPINLIMRMLRQHGGLLVEGSQAHNKGQIVGVAFPLHLNRPVVRSFFYQWIMRLELAMTSLIGLIFKKDDDWIEKKLLRDNVLIEAYDTRDFRRENEKREPRISECLYIRESLVILNFAFQERSQFYEDPVILWFKEKDIQIKDKDKEYISVANLKKLTRKDLVFLRNAIMHPNTWLVSNDDKAVNDLIIKYIWVKLLTDTLYQKIQEKQIIK